MNQESTVLVLLFVCIGSICSLTNKMQQQRFYLRLLNKKLDALLKAQGVEWPSLSPEVQLLAEHPSTKITAIKLHREENPDIGLAEAKAEVEAFAAKSMKHSNS
jgi:hypothetical protein